MKIYLDCCCFNRPFDDLRRDRVRIEADAIAAIFARVESGEWQLIGSDILLFELSRIPDENRRNCCLVMAGKATQPVPPTDELTQQIARLAALGIDILDAAHLANAEAGGADVFLTVDDALLRRVQRIGNNISVRAENPVTWLLELEGKEVP